MSLRKTAIQQVERSSFGGSFYDSQNWAAMFRSYSPVDFGVIGGQTFASELGSHIVNKAFMWYTLAQGHVMELPGGHNDYSWKLYEDAEVRATITRSTTGTQLGKAGNQIKFYLDRNWFEEPTVLRTEGRDQPGIRIIGEPVQVSANEWEYTGVIQDGDPLSFIETRYFEAGRTMMDAFTVVADEANMKYSGIHFGNLSSLQSWIGYVARKVEVSDKFIRLEKSCRESKTSVPNGQGYMFGNKMHHSAIGTGYVISNAEHKVDKKKMIDKGYFIPTVNAILEERIMSDKELAMFFGRLENTSDFDTGRPAKVPPGWLQIAKDGHYVSHSGNITIGDFYDFLNSKFTTRKDFMERPTVLRSGSGGLEFFSRLIAIQAGVSGLTFLDSFFIDEVPAAHLAGGKGLQWGNQFSRIKLPNGHLIECVHDPMKDNPIIFPEKADNSYYTEESFSFDIWDLGETDAAPSNARTKSNIAYVFEPEAEENFVISNVYDPISGSIKDGSSVSNLNKEAGFYKASSYGLAVWDTSRIARWEYRN